MVEILHTLCCRFALQIKKRDEGQGGGQLHECALGTTPSNTLLHPRSLLIVNTAPPQSFVLSRSSLLFKQPSTLGHKWVRDDIPNQEFARVWGYCIDDQVGAELNVQDLRQSR